MSGACVKAVSARVATASDAALLTILLLGAAARLGRYMARRMLYVAATHVTVHPKSL